MYIILKPLLINRMVHVSYVTQIKSFTQNILVVPHLECTTSAWEQGSFSERGEVCLLYVTGSGLLSSMTAHLYEEYLPECQTADNIVRNGV